MNTQELKDNWLKEEKREFKGWDFTYLNDRWEQENLPWDYRKIVTGNLSPTKKLLDMGTGGGEFLLSLNHPCHLTSVTEKWEPNAVLCKKKLEPSGICVKQIFKEGELPFDDDSFDIIINRHESYNVNAVRRKLKKDGLFITQQVGGKNNNNLSERILKNYKPQEFNFNLSHELMLFTDEGFEVIYSNEYYPYLRFFDIGALVYWAGIIKWEFPGFSVNNCFEQLLELESEKQKNGYIESRQHRFIMVLKNKKGYL